MSLVVLDCSVTMTWCFEDESREPTDALFKQVASGGAWVPAIWPLEVANVLLVAERSDRLTAERSTEFLTVLSHLNIRVDEDTTEHAFRDTTAIARRCRLSAYDAAYVELAARRSIPLATLDGRLQAAAQTLNVSCVATA